MRGIALRSDFDAAILRAAARASKNEAQIDFYPIAERRSIGGQLQEEE